MVERKLEGPQGDEPVFFSFICPAERLDEVRELFGKNQNLGVLSDADELTPSARVFPDPDTGEVTIVKGIEMTGICLAKDKMRILDSLADRKIAGYSRPTQILFPTQEHIEAQQRIQDEIKRHNDELKRRTNN